MGDWDKQASVNNNIIHPIHPSTEPGLALFAITHSCFVCAFVLSPITILGIVWLSTGLGWPSIPT